MNNATMNSDRLQRVYRALLTGPKTTRELIEMTGSCSISSIISELRACGIGVAKAEKVRQGVYRYHLKQLF